MTSTRAIREIMREILTSSVDGELGRRRATTT
jgi:hypothetical protein